MSNFIIQQTETTYPKKVNQNHNQLIDAVTEVEIQDEEITETIRIRKKGDYRFLQLSKSETNNHNINMRNR